MSATGTAAFPAAGRVGRRLASIAGTRWGYAAAVVAVCAAIVVTAVYSYRAVDRELTESALSRRASVSYLAAAVLSEKLDRLVDIGISLASRVRFRELIEAGKWQDAIKILSSVPRDFPFIERVTLIDPSGTMMADVPELPGVKGQNFAHRDWYQGIKRNWKPFVSRVYKRAALPQLNVFVVVVPIKDSRGGVLGILLLQLLSDTFFDWTRNIDVGPEGFVYVVDRHGTVAFHPKFPPQGELTVFSGVPAVRRVLQGSSGVEIASGPIDKEDRVVAYEPMTKYGWGVVVQQPSATAFATRDAQLRRVLIAYGLIFIFVVSVAYLASRIVIQRRQADTDRRLKAELERAVAERTAQLEATNKELESFSYSVSHDLRSPLRAIDGFSRILQEDHNDKLDDEARRLLGVIRDSSQRMGQLIDDLLAFSRLGRKPLSTAGIDMNRLVEDVLREVHAASGRLPKLMLGALPPARGDAALIKQAWTNLLDNAVKFSGKSEQPVIEVSGQENGAECVYCVRDNGAGFDMQYYDKLFGVFQRLHGVEEFPGTGVGLAMVQRVVTRHGGRIWAEGKVGEGAAFYFSLPKEKRDGQVQ